jgi:hypothetical protein
MLFEQRKDGAHTLGLFFVYHQRTGLASAFQSGARLTLVRYP